MIVTKKNIIKAINLATGFSPDLEKLDGSYYWRGDEASLFSDSCLYISTLTNADLDIDFFVNDFKQKIVEVENEYSESFADVIKFKFDIPFQP